MDPSVLKTVRDELNTEGLFLESAVFRFFLENSSFEVRREEPYSGFTSQGFEGTLDVLAVTRVREDFIVCLAIECKKADPTQKHWVFELRSTEEEPTFPFEYFDATKGTSNYQKNIFFPSLGYDGMKYFDKAIQSFEFNEKSGKKNRNLQLGRPYHSMKQSNEAVSSFLDEKRSRLFEIADVNVDRSHILYLPIVVTTANLYTTNYSTEDISFETGEIDVNGLELNKKNWVHYEFPLPYHLISRVKGGVVGKVKRPTFVVSSHGLPNFIDGLLEDAKSYVIEQE